MHDQLRTETEGDDRLLKPSLKIIISLASYELLPDDPRDRIVFTETYSLAPATGNETDSMRVKAADGRGSSSDNADKNNRDTASEKSRARQR